MLEELHNKASLQQTQNLTFTLQVSLFPINLQAILNHNILEIHETARELWIKKPVSSTVKQSLLNLIKQPSFLQRFTLAVFIQEASRSLLWQKLIYSHITESILAA